MAQFDHILNWTLKQGSHRFPGPDGGTCINEAAVVAAGYPYRPVHRVTDMPRSFSRPICRLAMRLNDEADDVQRQQLLPFVTRLACADSRAVEHARQMFIDARTRRPLSFDQGLAVLEEVLKIGRQAEPIDGADLGGRMEHVRARAVTAASSPEKTLSAKLKQWLGMKEPEAV
ncbi:hypothetical protein [Methylobacterium nodulans]|uniref:Uncharacterized protein n=1 Tax=Methylobacterium nodulans (strain LMG 21967 / CNCM I-2342 / ORS 2060) TaxID=460265 RepID=B8IF70_METNO|nr:hypothetical protein [Methylobacterium nodulans]ACL55781.1 conserved hypothetical protein [Methylobacterium nodulans ORS 2060]